MKPQQVGLSISWRLAGLGLNRCCLAVRKWSQGWGAVPTPQCLLCVLTRSEAPPKGRATSNNSLRIKWQTRFYDNRSNLQYYGLCSGQTSGEASVHKAYLSNTCRLFTIDHQRVITNCCICATPTLLQSTTNCSRPELHQTNGPGTCGSAASSASRVLCPAPRPPNKKISNGKMPGYAAHHQWVTPDDPESPGQFSSTRYGVKPPPNFNAFVWSIARGGTGGAPRGRSGT